MEAKKIIGLDPGPRTSHIVIVNETPKIVHFESGENEKILELLQSPSLAHSSILCLEMIEARGYTTSQDTPETAFWVGRFYEAFQGERHRYFRRMIKIHFTEKSNTKDSHIRQVLIDRYGGKGTKKAPGFFYGVKSDLWQAAAVALYRYEKTIKSVYPTL